MLEHPGRFQAPKTIPQVPAQTHIGLTYCTLTSYFKAIRISNTSFTSHRAPSLHHSTRMIPSPRRGSSIPLSFMKSSSDQPIRPCYPRIGTAISSVHIERIRVQLHSPNTSLLSQHKFRRHHMIAPLSRTHQSNLFHVYPKKGVFTCSSHTGKQFQPETPS